MTPTPGRIPTLAAFALAVLAAASAPGQTANRVVRLPPYLVSESRTKAPSQLLEKLWTSSWQYAAIPGFEILSDCGLEETEEFARDTVRQQAWLDEIVSPDLQLRSSVPTTLILFRDENRSKMAGDVAALAADNARRNGRLLAGAGAPTPTDAAELIPQVKLWDGDSTGVDILLKYRGPGGYGSIGFEPDYVLYLLARKAPALPAWFSAGALTLYKDRFVSDAGQGIPPKGLKTGGGTAPDSNTILQGRNSPIGDRPGRPLATEQYFPPATWISPELTEAMGRDPAFWTRLASSELPSRLIPVGELLTGAAPPPASEEDKRDWLARNGFVIHGTLNEDELAAKARLIVPQAACADSPWRHDVWRSEAMLIVRWALDDESRARARALWRFTARASTEAPTEGLFRECFGFGFKEADEDLDRYLPAAMAKGFSIVADPPMDFPQLELRPATEAEVSRLLGDWQRKEVELVRPSYPEYAAPYAEQAGVTLRRAYDDGSREPALLAALGLLACTEGNDLLARGYLEAAVGGMVVRPSAYVQLARIRLNAALAKPALGAGGLDGGQVSSVLVLIQDIQSQDPPQLTGYLLAAGALEHAAFAPDPGDLRVLERGLGFFPSDPRLIVAAAQLEAHAGRMTEAVGIIDRGLGRIVSPRLRKLLLGLRARYAGQSR